MTLMRARSGVCCVADTNYVSASLQLPLQILAILAEVNKAAPMLISKSLAGL